MRKLNLIIAIILITSSVINAVNVPETIEKAFKQKFPAITKVKWHKEGKNSYEASFIKDNKEVSAVYDLNGELKELETEIQLNDLPTVIKDAVSKNYPKAKIKEAAKIERADNQIIYETEIKINFKTKDILFDASGNKIN